MPGEANAPNNGASMTVPRPRRLHMAIAVVGLLGVGGLIGAGVVQAQMGGGGWDGPRWRDGWRGGDRDGMGPGTGQGMGGPRFMRLARFCGADTARFHPVVRAYVKADLRLNDAQAKDFDTLADQVLPALEDVKREACTNMAQISDKAPEKLAQLSSVLRKAADAADKAVDPARKFYATLDPVQQARVDELTDRRGQRRWR